MVSAGSSDQTVHIWDEPSTQELYFLPGHTGSVNEVGRVSILSLSRLKLVINLYLVLGDKYGTLLS